MHSGRLCECKFLLKRGFTRSRKTIGKHCNARTAPSPEIRGRHSRGSKVNKPLSEATVEHYLAKIRRIGEIQLN